MPANERDKNKPIYILVGLITYFNYPTSNYAACILQNTLIYKDCNTVSMCQKLLGENLSICSLTHFMSLDTSKTAKTMYCTTYMHATNVFLSFLDLFFLCVLMHQYVPNYTVNLFFRCTVYSILKLFFTVE